MSSERVARILGDSRWVGAQIAKAQVALRNGASKEDTSRTLYESGSLSLKRSREIVDSLRDAEFESFLEKRTHTGSAENPISKLFPAAVTERQFLDKLDQLQEARHSVDYRDERFTGHTLVDFTLLENNTELPVNVKNAGTRFENAARLVGLDPDDCIPIPAYKAYDAIDKEPNLLYAFCVDYRLISKIEDFLLKRFSDDETFVWKILSTYAGSLIRDAEDRFVYSMVNRHWGDFSRLVPDPAFRIISARKAIRILQNHPKRTPGLGLRAWGTGASAENNVHISVADETKIWDEILTRIVEKGLTDVISAVNRKKTELVFDPEV
ncbi:MAG: hypothetical protein LBP92_13135 [Deltaproteobacteria bacterium]|nr:hypothetical protein [Deltaproteobacteria bacterium]